MSEETTLSSRILASHSGTSLVDYLCGRFKYHSRAEWEAIIRAGSVSLNNAPSEPGRLLKKGDVVSYTVVLREPPVDRNITILHEEESFLAAVKPGNLPSHADGNFIKNTFIYILRERMKAAGYNGPVKLVHRLDRETSGILLVAKTDDAHRTLTRQFEQGSVDKEYLAVTRGVIAKDSFEVSGAIAPDPASAISIRQRVVPEGAPGARSASTRFEVIERLADATLVRCIPATGRTNQIRVHLAHAGHPLVGDKLYGKTDDQFLEFVRNARAGKFDILPWMEAPRHLLHASRLALDHPKTGERVSFVNEIPGDMISYIEKTQLK